MLHKYVGAFPNNKELEDATIIAIRQLDGMAETCQINQKVIEILDLPEEIVLLEDENDLGTKLSYRLRWARTSLKSKGLIINEKRGTWKLADYDKDCGGINV